jgi:nitroreductase/FMN reductase [NAD(P)H]
MVAAASDPRAALAAALERRFGDAAGLADAATGDLDALARLTARRVCRRYADRPVDPALVRLLAATALSAPSKSDLQQRDVVVVTEPERRLRLVALAGDDAWMRAAPVFVVFVGNHRRQRALAEWHGTPFPNDHLDPFFNAAVDGAIALAWFVAAAEAAGLGCCPISLVRNRPRELAELLALPPLTFPVAGLTLGWPADEGTLSPRLPLAATVHAGRFDDARARALIAAYDARRQAIQPFARQRDPARFGTAPAYGWSVDKARQYADPQRADWGAFVRAQGFRLD